MARILIVDDDLVTLRLAACALAAHGHDVRVATTAEEGWRMLGAAPADLALIDRSLPGMDGLALTRRIKSAPALEHVIVLACSGHGALEDDARAREAGSDGFVPKPLDLHHLLRCVAWHLAAKPSRLEPFDDDGSPRRAHGALGFHSPRQMGELVL